MSEAVKQPSRWLDFGLLVRHRHFRQVFIARTLSLFGLGLLTVAIPLQVFELSGDTANVALAMALEGASMFVGLLWGGVLADRHDRRRLILWARAACGLGFVALALNAANPWGGTPATVLGGIYVLAMWDGFCGAVGVTALLAAMPHIVGRDNLLQARALSVLSMRLATVASPALGGMLIAASGVEWAYGLTAAATLLTLWPLRALPTMRPPPSEDSHPLRALADGWRYLLSNRVVASVALVGALVTLVTAIRVLFPALAHGLPDGGAFEVGLMYSAVPLGAALSTLGSGWLARCQRPGLAMQLIGLSAFGCVLLLGWSPHMGVTLPLLAVLGGLVSLAGLLQYTVVQGHTPDAYLGRVNGLWTAQDALGDTVGTLAVGWLAQSLSPALAVSSLGGVTLLLGLWALVSLSTLRRAGAEASPSALAPAGAPS